MLYESAMEWWEHHIIKGNEPEMIWSPNVEKWLNSHFSHRNSIMVPAGIEAIQKAMELDELDQKIKEIEQEQENLKAFLKKEIGDNDGIEWGKGKKKSTITWKKSKDGVTTAWKSVVDKCLSEGLVPDQSIIDEFSKEKPGSRSFRKNIKQ